MVAKIADQEVVIPGVGVYYPRDHWLEGSSDSLRDLQCSELIARLTVYVHRPEDLEQTLSQPKLAGVQRLVIDYRTPFVLASLKQALAYAKIDPAVLREVEVRGNGYILPHEADSLRRMYRCLAGAKVKVFGIELPESPVRPLDEQVWEDEDTWFRHVGDEIAIPAFNLVWVQEQVLDRGPRMLTIDCDEQFLVAALDGILCDGRMEGLQVLNLNNVVTTSSIFLGWLDKLKLPSLREFRLTSRDPALKAVWLRAIQAFFRRKPHLHGAEFWFNGVKQ